MNKISEFLSAHSRDYCAQKFTINEREKEIFSTCKGTRIRKRVHTNMGVKTGSILVGIRVGTHTTCVCKHKM